MKTDRSPIDIISKNLEIHASRLELAQDRVKSLFSIYDSTAASNAGRDDILRAIVVLLHATLEEALRIYKASVLIDASPEELNRVPIAGTKGRNPEKFFLGKLAEYRGRTINGVIRESVLESVRSESFNAVSDISSVISLLKINDSGLGILKKYLPVINSVIRRRHLIAHEGDCVAKKKSLQLRPITRKVVKSWSEHVFSLIAVIVIFVESGRANASKINTA